MTKKASGQTAQKKTTEKAVKTADKEKTVKVIMHFNFEPEKLKGKETDLIPDEVPLTVSIDDEVDVVKISGFRDMLPDQSSTFIRMVMAEIIEKSGKKASKADKAMTIEVEDKAPATTSKKTTKKTTAKKTTKKTTTKKTEAKQEPPAKEETVAQSSGVTKTTPETEEAPEMKASATQGDQFVLF